MDPIPCKFRWDENTLCGDCLQPNSALQPQISDPIEGVAESGGHIEWGRSRRNALGWLCSQMQEPDAVFNRWDWGRIPRRTWSGIWRLRDIIGRTASRLLPLRRGACNRRRGLGRIFALNALQPLENQRQSLTFRTFTWIEAGKLFILINDVKRSQTFDAVVSLF